LEERERETTVTDPKIRKALTMYRLSEHSLAIEKGRRRQREDRLCAHCPQNEEKTEPHFLTSCRTHKEFENKYNFDKLPYLLGEKTHCAITAT
jgi:hypothetical protein